MRTETRKLEIGQGSGVKGLVDAFRRLLSLRRLDHVSIDRKGVLEVTLRLPEGEEFELPTTEVVQLTPAEVIAKARSFEVVSPPGEPVLRAVLRLFEEAKNQVVVPVAFLASRECIVWSKVSEELGHPFDREFFFGYDVFFDEGLPRETLVLAACLSLDGSLSDVTHLFVTSIGD